MTLSEAETRRGQITQYARNDFFCYRKFEFSRLQFLDLFVSTITIETVNLDGSIGIVAAICLIPTT